MNYEMADTTNEAPPVKIGLALSGGGFRASIFHLGVIRRLEELGIMPSVSVISSVSGGSIIAAYYVIEMEKRLRLRRSRPAASGGAPPRVSIFEEIATDFFAALDENLRTRALVFSPFYHPLLWLKSLWPGVSRSDLMQCEYDRWFYHGNTLDQLPSVTRDRMGDPHPSAGPKLVLNTTSLLTGERVAFSREPLSSLKEVKGVNKNILALSRIVGASSGVPVLFPPTPVLGDLLVDGGVSDNQGIEALLEEKCNILLVSDASGQMEPVHSLSSKESSVFGRVNEILQFQVRTKLLDRLVAWKQQEENRWFAFVHLFLNLKDRAPEVPRVPSEYIPGIARTRTDLDQFSFVEREALMYHGYTLIDAQLQKYCGPVVERIPRAETGLPPMRTAPLFSKAAAGEADLKVEERRRSRIQKELALAATKMLLVRSLQKYPGKTAQAFLVGAAPMLALSASLFLRFKDSVLPSLASALGNWLAGAIPAPALSFLDSFLEGGNLPTVTTIAGAVGLLLGYIILLALPLYVSSFTWYLATRSASVKADRQTYRQLSAGKDPSPSWPSDAEERS